MTELGIRDRTFRNYRQALERLPGFIDANGDSLLVVEGRGDGRRMMLRQTDDKAFEDTQFAVRYAGLNYARQTFQFLGDTELGEDIATFCQDYVACIKGRTFILNDLLRDGDRKFYYLPWAPKEYGGRRKEVRIIMRALTDNRKLAITYESRNESGERIVNPLTLVMWKSGLYLVVQASDRKRIYMMAVDRIKSVAMRPESFRYPERKAYDPATHLDGGFGIFVDQNRTPKTFELLFAADGALQRDIRERRWVNGQTFKTEPDGRMRMTFTVTTDIEVWPWIRSFGGLVEVVRPQGGR
jgi:hypothetical protein